MTQHYERTCGNCAFSDFDVGPGEPPLCRRHPPRIVEGIDRVADSSTEWPEVHDTEWCGEHRTEAEYERERHPLLQVDADTGEVTPVGEGPIEVPPVATPTRCTNCHRVVRYPAEHAYGDEPMKWTCRP